MAGQITKDGIQIPNLTEIADSIIEGSGTRPGLKSIFGNDTNFDQDSPDAQLTYIFSQCARDIYELVAEVFNSFDPDQASGSVLDARVLYNGVIRKGGKYTKTGITIITNREVSLRGVDGLQTDAEIQAADPKVFTIQDYNGNQYYLEDSTTLASGTTTGVVFRARYMGDVWYTPHSINQIVTPQRGVVSVDNPRQEIEKGEAQETDAELKLRRARAVYLGMMGAVEVMEASLRQLTGVVDARVFENREDYPSEDGIPAHGIWVVVRGGTKEDIANVIYLRLSDGCQMRGSTVVPVERVFGDTLDVKFDFAQKENLSIRLTAQPINGVDVMDPAVLADYIASHYNFWIYQPATATEVDSICKSYNSEFSYSDIEISADPNTRGSLTTEDAINVENFRALSSGSLNITIDGTDTVQVNGLVFTGCTSAVDVAIVIAAAFADANIPATADSDGEKITLYSLKRGTGSSIAVNAITTAFVDLSGESYFDGPNMFTEEGDPAEQGFQQCNQMTETRLAALRAVTDGSFKLTVNMGNALDVTGLDFSSCTTTQDVVNVLNTAFGAIGAACYADYQGLAVYIYSNLYGATSSIAIEDGTSGTNVRTAELLVNPLTDAVDGTNGTNGYALTGVLDYSDFTGVFNGALSIRVNGANARSVTGLNFSQVTSVEEIANIINNAFAQESILATATYDTGAICFTSNIPGEGSSIALATFTGELVDISGSDYLHASTMVPSAGQSPTQWETLIFPVFKNNYFEVDADYITVTIPDNE